MNILISRFALTCLIIGGTATASCSQAKEPSRPSLLPELAALAPVIACIDSASRDQMTELDKCARGAGISFNNPPSDPKAPNDFKPMVLSAWLMLDSDPVRQLRPETFARAIDYAKCVESAAYAEPGFSSRTEKGFYEAQVRAEYACKEHPLSIRAFMPQDAAKAADLPARLFATAVANLAMRYALEANGWYPNEMRECIQYADGRPPSIGCSVRPRGKPPVAPFPPNHNPPKKNHAPNQ